MIRVFLICLLFIPVTNLFSQYLKAVVLNPDQEIVPQADIYKNGFFIKEANVFGSFEMKVEPEDEIKVYSAGFQPGIYKVPANMPDTFFVTINLVYKYQEIYEVIVTTDGIKRIVGKKDEYILDYQPLAQDHFYILKSIGRSYFLCLENLKGLLTQKKIDFKPESLYRDFLGNFHVLSKDSVYQIFLEEEIKLMHGYPKQYFTNFLQPVVATTKNGIFSEGFSRNNQQYDLFHKSVEKDFELVLRCKDSVAEKIASETYNRVVAVYYKTTQEIANIILNGIWDGDLTKLANSYTIPLIGLYKIRSRPLNISSTDRGNEVLTFDFLNHLIYHTPKLESIPNKVEMSAFGSYDKLKLLPDYETGKYYLVEEIEGVSHIYSIDPDTGVISELKEIKGASFLRKMKINNGIVYFLNPVNDFMKLFQIRL